MNWLSDLLKKDEIEYGKDIIFDIYNNIWDFPKEGKADVIYCERGYMNIEGRRYIWAECSGKKMYLLLVC